TELPLRIVDLRPFDTLKALVLQLSNSTMVGDDGIEPPTRCL
ncbi:hypothetical protein ALQ89_00191, partial [Pseudomonas amygdali pv. tabaci]